MTILAVFAPKPPLRRAAHGALAAAVVVLLGGCATHLSTRPDWQVTAATASLEGVPYSLPMLQYDLTLTRLIDSCPQPLTISNGMLVDKAPDAKPIIVTQGGLSLVMKVEAAERYVAGERYAIDYESLKAPFSTSALALASYPSGALKSLNASADDQTGQVIKDGLRFGFSVAAQTAGVPQIATSGGPISFTEFAAPTSPKDQQRLAAIADLKDRVNAIIPTTFVACKPLAALLAAQSQAKAAEQADKTELLEMANADVTRATAVAGLRNAQVKHIDALDLALTSQTETATALKKLIAEKAALDGGLRLASKRVWPRRFDGRMENLPLGEAGRETFGDLLELRTERVITAQVVADWIAAWRTTNPALAEELAQKDEFKPFLRADGSAVPKGKATPGCDDNQATVEACLASRFDARVGLSLASTELPPCPAPAPTSLACRPAATAVDEGKSQVATPAFGTTQHRPPTPVAAPSPFPRGRNARDLHTDPGVFFRSPAAGVLGVCQGFGPLDEKGNLIPDEAGKPRMGELDSDFTSCGGKVFASKPMAAPQLGQLRFLPVRNEAFEASELSLVLREDGSLETFGYKKTRAAGTGVAAALADAAEQRKTYEAGRAAALTSARTQHLAGLQFQIDDLSKQKDLLKLLTPAAPDALKAVKDETAALEAQIALLKAEKGQLDAAAQLAAARALPAP